MTALLIALTALLAAAALLRAHIVGTFPEHRRAAHHRRHHIQPRRPKGARQ